MLRCALHTRLRAGSARLEVCTPASPTRSQPGVLPGGPRRRSPEPALGRRVHGLAPGPGPPAAPLILATVPPATVIVTKMPLHGQRGEPVSPLMGGRHLTDID